MDAATPVRLTLRELRCLFVLAARHAAASPSSWPLALLCRVVRDNAGVLGRAECRVVARLLAGRPEAFDALDALGRRLAELPPERLPKRPGPLTVAEVYERPPKRTGRISLNPRARVRGYDYHFDVG